MKYILLARNAYLSSDIEDFLKELQNKANNAKVKKYIASNIRKYLVNDFPATQVKRPSKDSPSWLKEAIRKGEEVFKVQLKAKDKNTISHWIDYLNTLPEGKDLSRISISQLINHVKEWEESFRKGSEEEDGIEEIHKYNDGYKWVEVFGKQSLKREGKLMNHCVGSYYSKVSKGKCSIYSLRDKNNKPHVTIEIRDKEIKQIQGNSNKPPKEEYHKYVLDFLNKKYVKFDEINNFSLGNLGYVQINTKIYPKNNLPNNLTIKGDLDLSDTRISKLPDNLTVTGDLRLSVSEISHLPKNLTVGGGLYLKYSSITKLPNGLAINGNLDISGSEITRLPSNLTVKGDFDMSDTAISKIPKGLTVGGSLDISYTYVTNLSNLITINGNNLITINGNLNLAGTDVVLPNNLKVKGNLDIRDTKIKEIPEGIKAKKIIISDDMKVINHSKSIIKVQR